MKPISLSGLFKIVDEGDLSKHPGYEGLETLDMTKNIRQTILADLLVGGEIPKAGTDEFKALQAILNDLDRQAIEIKKNNTENTKVGAMLEAAKSLVLENPSRIGSAVDIIKHTGENPAKDYDTLYDKEKLQGFTFTEGELNNEPNNLSFQDCVTIVKDYQADQVAKAKEQ